jgi:hypothetical protein
MNNISQVIIAIGVAAFLILSGTALVLYAPHSSDTSYVIHRYQ